MYISTEFNDMSGKHHLPITEQPRHVITMRRGFGALCLNKDSPVLVVGIFVS